MGLELGLLEGAKELLCGSLCPGLGYAVYGTSSRWQEAMEPLPHLHPSTWVLSLPMPDMRGLPAVTAHFNSGM